MVSSTGRVGQVMRQSTGKGLYAAYDGVIGNVSKRN